VLRRIYPLAAAAIALLVPTLGGGSDVLLASSVDLGVARDTRVVGPGSCANASWLPEDERPLLPQRPTHARELLLSFDDGPDLRGTPMILDELDRRGLKAIFFVTGWRLTGNSPEDQARRDLVRKIARHGHLVANHTMTHKNLCEFPAEQAAEIDGASEIVAQSTGVRPLLFRAPYGAICASLQASLKARDLPNVRWNLDPQDWKSEDHAEIYKYLTERLSHLEGRGILLLHDTHIASVEALPAVLDWIVRENRRAVGEARPPITLVDYSVMLPARAPPSSGLETIVARVAGDAGGAIGRLFGQR
jgi:peptidoglycan/xylan/chitin deacetylase (PgdA/CDA1 family)